MIDLALVGWFSYIKRCKSDQTTMWYTLDNDNAGGIVTFNSQLRKYLMKKFFTVF